MKKSSFAMFTCFMILVEVVYSVYAVNTELHFWKLTLQDKYVTLLWILYAGCVVWLCIGLCIIPDIESSEKNKREEYLKLFGKTSYNFVYTYHHVAFAGACFVGSSYVFLIPSVVAFIVYNLVRARQNGYAENYELEAKKEQAKGKVNLNDV